MIEKLSVILLVGLLATLTISVESANILAIFTSNSPSHQIVHISHVKALCERGHNVTVITTHALKDKNPQYNHIIIPENEARKKSIGEAMSKIASHKITSPWQYYQFAKTALRAIGPVQYDAIKSKQFQDIMNNPDNKFDLVILGYFFSDYHLGLGEHFKCPIVISLTAGMNQFVDRYVGNPAEIAYVPSLMTLVKNDPRTFMGRLEYFYQHVLSKMLVYTLDQQFLEFYNDLFPPSKYPPMEEAAKRVSLILANSHLSDGVIRPSVPGVIDVGGIQIKDKPAPLPKDLQEIIDSSKHGVIYLSFGSNLGSKEVGEENIKNLYAALSGLKETVLWKWDDSPKPGNSPNIHYKKWLPQDDLLAQQNVKLFITHAGLGGVAEAQFHGVPMVAIPMFGDQPKNAKKLYEDGFGVQLDKNNLTVESIRTAVLEVLENPKYTANVQRFSKIYRDRPMTAKQMSVFWIEYVLRHKGAYHMQSPAVHLNAFQIVSLDVIGFLLLVIYLVYKSIALTIMFLYRKMFCRSKAKNQKVKKQ